MLLMIIKLYISMSVRNKIRVGSQNHSQGNQKIYRSKEQVVYGIKKTPSMISQCSSPMRITDKNSLSPGKKPTKLHIQSEMEQMSEQRQPVLQEGRLWLLQKKISQQKLKEIPYIQAKQEKGYQMLFSSKMGTDQVITKMKLQSSKKPKVKKQQIFFTKGNNAQLLKDLFVDKYGFSQTLFRQNASICWLQTANQKDLSMFNASKSLHQQHLPDINKVKEHSNVIYNYLEGQSQLTNKQKIYRNMKRYYPDSIGTYIPKSFSIDFRQEKTQVQENLLQFMSYYFKKDKNKKPRNKSVIIKNYFMEITIPQKVLNKMIEKSVLDTMTLTQQDKPKEKEEDEEEVLWILKPTTLNRGRGIHVFSTLKQLSKLLSQSAFEISIKMYSQSFKPKAYIIQQYINRPLLIDGYKFDMRFWVLLQVVKLNGKKYLKVHLFEHGYSRLASVRFECDQGQKVQKVEDHGDSKELSKQDKNILKKDKKAYINNKFIHLTNNAVQRQAKEYGQYCEGNQLSLEDTVKYFQNKDAQCSLTLGSLKQKVTKIVLETVSSIRQKLVASNIPKTFQLLGYDFLIDQDYNMWFIEVNCNPCLEQSSHLVGGLLRKMVEGMINLTNLDEGKGPDKADGWATLL